MIKKIITFIAVFFLYGMTACGEKTHYTPVNLNAVSALPFESNTSDILLNVKSNALTGGTWSTPIVLGTEPAGSELSVDLSVSGQGDYLSAWGNALRRVSINTPPQVSIKIGNTTQWNSLLPFVIDPDDVVSQLKYHTNSVTDDSYITWWSDKSASFFMSYYSGNGNWASAVQLGAQSIHDIEIDASGNATIVWFESTVVGTIEIYLRKYFVATGLTHMYTLRRGDAFPETPLKISHLSMSSKPGITKIAWTEKSNELLNGIAQSSTYIADFIDDVGWQAVEEVDTKLVGFSSQNEIIKMSLVEDPVLNSYELVLISYDPQNPILKYQFYGVTFENDAWSAPAILDFNDIEGDIVYSSVEKNTQGSFVVLWMENLSNVTGSIVVIRCRRYTAGQGWNALEIISTPIVLPPGSTANSIFPQIGQPDIAMNDGGDIIVTWYAPNIDRTNVWVNHYSQITGWGFPEVIANTAIDAMSGLTAGINPVGEPVIIWQEKSTDVSGDIKNIVVTEYTL